MPVPQGQQIAGKPYREITAAELGVLGVVVPAGGQLQTQAVPWWAGGYSLCHLFLNFSGLAGGGNVALQATGWDSTQGFTIYDNITNGPTGENFPPGGGAMEFNFDDGIIPGNYRVVQVVPGAPKGMPLNPTWNKNAFLSFSLVNNAATPLTLNGFTIQLRGR